MDVPAKEVQSYSSYLDSQGYLWLIFNTTLYSMDLNIKNIKAISPPKNKIELPSNSVVFNIYPFWNKGILISTKMNGLYLFYAETGKLYHESYKYSQYDVPEGRLNAVFADSNDNLWLASNDKGFLVVHKENRNFNIYNSLIKITQEKSVTSLAIDKNDNLWIGTPDNYNVIVSDLKNRDVNIIDLRKFIDSKYLTDKISRIYIDSENHIWFLINNMVFKCKYIHNKFKLENRYLLPTPMTSIVEDHNNTIWIGGFSEYIYSLSKDEKSFVEQKLYNNNASYINDILVLDSGDLLVTSFDQSLQALSADSLILKDHNKIYNVKRSAFGPTYLYRDSKENVWLGTLEQGLFSYSIKTKEVKVYNSDPFRREINSIIEDNNGHIWAGTSSGLIDVDPKTQHVTPYYAYDGIGGNQFNQHAVCSLSDSILFFGGTHGLTIIDQSRKKKTKKIPLHFENLIINNQIQKPYNNQIIRENILSIPEINLENHHNNVEITYAALDFDKYRNLRYFYKMDGYDDDWIGGRSNRQAIYSNLPPGNYVFRVKVTNNDNNETIAENSIIVKKEQIIWLRWPMIMLYIIIVISFAALLNYLYLKGKANKTKAVLIETEKQHEVYINRMNMKFFTNMSHEFRTPLTMIVGPTSTLLKDNISGVEKKELLQILDKSVTRMLKLLNQIMDFNKLEEDTLKLEKEKTNLVSIINETIKIFIINAEKRNISFITEGLDKSYILSFDIDKVGNILENILSNALKFTPNNGSIKLYLNTLSKDQVERSYNADNMKDYSMYIEVSVENSGSYIPEDKLCDIFKRYFQIEDPIRKTHNLGTGIGLYYAKQLVMLHNGFIKADNIAEDKVVFRFVLPVDNTVYYSSGADNMFDIQMNTCDGLEKLIDERKKNISKINNANTILIVDDDVDISQYLNTLLSPYYCVINCFDAESAYDILNKKAPDIIVSDVRMPGTNGYQFCEKIKMDIMYSHIPVILLTAKSLVEEQIHGLSLGANAYITKPFAPEYLLALLDSQLKNRDRIRDLIMHNPLDKILNKDNLSIQDSTFLNNLYDLMDKELSDSELDMAQVSQKLNMSRTKFFYKVKGLTGTTPNSLFRNYKLNKAANLLREGQYNISEIADMTGYKTPSHFSVSFKKQFGVSPSDYIK